VPLLLKLLLLNLSMPLLLELGLLLLGLLEVPLLLELLGLLLPLLLLLLLLELLELPLLEWRFRKNVMLMDR
jgi:hypothetical protein